MNNKCKLDCPKRSGFEDIPKEELPCRHPEHNPPSHLCIPAGKRYRHICPGCGNEMVINSSAPVFKA